MSAILANTRRQLSK